MLDYYFHGLCTFPDMVINENIATKSGKKGGKIDMIWTVVDNAWVLLTSVHTSEYGN